MAATTVCDECGNIFTAHRDGTLCSDCIHGLPIKFGAVIRKDKFHAHDSLDRKRSQKRQSVERRRKRMMKNAGV